MSQVESVKVLNIGAGIQCLWWGILQLYNWTITWVLGWGDKNGNPGEFTSMSQYDYGSYNYIYIHRAIIYICTHIHSYISTCNWNCNPKSGSK